MRWFITNASLYYRAQDWLNSSVLHCWFVIELISNGNLKQALLSFSLSGYSNHISTHKLKIAITVRLECSNIILITSCCFTPCSSKVTAESIINQGEPPCLDLGLT